MEELNIPEVGFPIPDFKSFSNRDRRNSESYISKHCPELYSYLICKYPEESFSYKERLYMFLHSMEEPCRCAVCGNYTKLQDLKSGFRRYCSSKCSNSDPEKMELTKRNNLEKYGVENVSEMETVKNKKRKNIEKKLECDPEYYAKVEEKRKKTNIERYGDANYRNNEGRKKTCIERFGVEHPSQSEEIKEKKKTTLIEHYGVDHQSKAEEVKEKKRKTSLEHYGVECPLQSEEVKDKIRKTNLERYGFEVSSKNPDVIAKAKETLIDRFGENYQDELAARRENTCVERYGVRNAMQDPEIKRKMEETCISRYGVANPLQNPKIREKFVSTVMERYGVKNPSELNEIKEKKKKTMMERYGVENPFSLPGNLETQNSRPNMMFASILTNNGIGFSREFSLPGFRYDFKVGNTLIEINPTASHNSTFGIFGKDPIDKLYHKNKTKNAVKFGYNCIHVWDWDDCNKVVNLLKPRESIFARDCSVVEITKTEANGFLDEHHIQNGCSGQKVCISLKRDDEIVEVMTFGKPRYNKNVEWELLRLCTKTGFTVIGGSEKLFKYFIEHNNPESIVSYCDLSKFTGGIYTRLGFKETNNAQPSEHWYNQRTGQHITGNFLRKHGFDQIFKTDYGKGTSNEELMVANKFVKIYDCGQATYIWRSEPH